MSRPDISQSFVYVISLAMVACTGSTTSPYFTYPQARQQMKAGWQRVADIKQRIQTPTFSSQDFDVLEYGAVADSAQDSQSGFAVAV